MENPPERNVQVRAGKTSKYLKYAIGEIVLVVIGILIALQINNWNDQRLNRELEANYYKRLIEDLNEDKALLTATFNYKMTVYSNAKKAIQLFYNPKEYGLSPQDALIALYQASQSQNPQSSTSTYLEMLSSGKIDLIQNDTIKTSIIRYYELDWANASTLALTSGYRQNLRSKMPDEVQTEIRKKCGDTYVKIRTTYEVALPEKCSIDIDAKKASSIIAILQKDESIKKDLLFQIGNVDAMIGFLNNAKHQANDLSELIKTRAK